jgi:hypothetical protein
MPAAIAYLHERRRRTRGDDPIDIGAGARVYVGDPPWDIGPDPLTGAPDQIAEKLRAFRPLGVNHLQIRLRARSLEEFLDQMDAFHTRVAPLLN